MSITTIKQDITNLEAAMAPVRKLAAKLAEMQAAVSTLAQQENSLAALKSRLAEAEKLEAVKANAIDRIKIVRVTHAGKDRPGPATRRTVEYMERVHGMYGEEARPGSLALDGMSRELAWALLADPKKIPADIRALADDPEEALSLHCRYVRRGWA